MMLETLIDTDTLSAILKRRPSVVGKAQSYLALYSRMTLSVITRFEILRGLKAIRAESQAKAFDLFCEANLVLPVTDSIIFRAAEIYANLYQRGLLIGDADILIASTALEHGLVLTTNNTHHFNRIADLQLQNWQE